MGTLSEPRAVKPFFTLLSAREDAHTAAIGVIVSIFGKAELITRPHPWDYSPAYTEELGPRIMRRFLVLSELADPTYLSDWKLLTVEMEKLFGRDGKRAVNIDPGYITGSNLVLASTKSYANRIYLRDGVYADFTLFYDGRAFCAHKLTLPDYRTRAAIRFFGEQRKSYLRQLSGMTAVAKSNAFQKQVQQPICLNGNVA